MMLLSHILPASLLLFVPAIAAVQVETIWSSVVVTTFGDRIPLLHPAYSVLTPLGAQQMYSLGSSFRDRYIHAPPSASSDHLINGISPFVLDNGEVWMITMYDVWIAQGAQAFIQGLYPPLTISEPGTNFTAAPMLLSNGSQVLSPLGGYQYADMYTTHESDPSYIFLEGSTLCPNYATESANYLASQQSTSLGSSAASFYSKFYTSVFEGTVAADLLNFSNAYELWDYLSYEYIHNATVNNNVALADLNQARYLADQYIYALNSNTSTSSLSTIGGRTLASQILADLMANIQYQGQNYRLNLLFTSFEPMVALASLLGLPSFSPAFTGMPDLGSSMVFELFSLSDTTPTSYPSTSDLQIRFLARNGTASSSPLTAYPILNSTSIFPNLNFTAFQTAIETLMISKPGTWCALCASTNLFCPGYSGTATSHTVPQNIPTIQKPYIAGILGALIALALAALLFAVLALLAGLRLRREPRNRQSQLGGFKGAERLASDVDLSSNRASMGATVVKAPGAGGSGGGKRVESWELREGRGVLSSFEAERRGVAEREGDLHAAGAVKAMESV